MFVVKSIHISNNGQVMDLSIHEEFANTWYNYLIYKLYFKNNQLQHIILQDI